MNELKHKQKLLKSIKKRSKEKNIDFNLTLADIKIPKICPVLNIPIIISPFSYINSPSVDKIDPTKGYTKDNVQVISMRANTLKNNSSMDELNIIINYLEGLNND